MVAAIIVIILIVALIVADVFLVVDHVPGNTWSEMLRNAATDTTFVPWSLAVICGRWFHPVDSLQPLAGEFGSIAVLMVTSWLVVVIGTQEIPPRTGLDHSPDRPAGRGFFLPDLVLPRSRPMPYGL